MKNNTGKSKRKTHRQVQSSTMYVRVGRCRGVVRAVAATVHGKKVRTVARSGFSWKAFSTVETTKTNFQDQGLLDAQGLTVFNTLHELQETACKVYPKNELFGTFSEESLKFEYLSYEEFGGKVDKCRSVLSHLGECAPKGIWSMNL